MEVNLISLRVNALRQLQSQTQEELDALLPSAPQRTAGATAGDRREGRLRESCNPLPVLPPNPTPPKSGAAGERIYSYRVLRKGKEN